MLGRLFGLVLALLAVYPGTASAARVLVMARDGHVSARNDPFLARSAQTPAPAPENEFASPRASASRVAFTSRVPAKAPKTKPGPTVLSVLTHLYRTNQISSTTYLSDTASFNGALASFHRLRGTRAAELDAVIENLHQMAVAGKLTPARLPVLFLTLNSNRQWWTTGPLLSPGQEIEFAGSQLVWEYYAGQGLELQVLATFGRADGMYTAGSSEYPQMEQLLAQMIPLAVPRAGGIAWEYYFDFDGGTPPWVSAMAQGTALEALTRAYQATSQASYLQTAASALALFTAAPPTGVRIATSAGARYLQYSFAPGTDIINAFLQSLIGLYDYAQVSGNQEAQQLFAAGNTDAEAEVPGFDTGAWSLYQPGVMDDLNYHELVTGFLEQLCQRTQAPVYCNEAQRFEAYLTTPPTLQLLTTQVTARSPLRLRFRVSKPAHVGVVLERGSSTVFLTSASFSGQLDAFAVPALKAGTYSVRLAGTDLAGNFNRIVSTLQVTKPARPAHGSHAARSS